ncbi:hypothetical protein F2Q70_00043693 [Brassica cretica]|uniref:Uncharacterized protein n=1 Tax=Brassica cretica TaxID=69181 RepID=A0A8S9KI12_BRACR|nr:hypothetical protein F2Q70_00043693 [Brassica cretica]
MDGSKFNRTKWRAACKILYVIARRMYAITWNNLLFMAIELSQGYHWVSYDLEADLLSFFSGQLSASQHPISRNDPRTPISRTPMPHHHHSDFHQITLSVLYNVRWSVVVEPINPRRRSCRRCTRLRHLEAFQRSMLS